MDPERFKRRASARRLPTANLGISDISPNGSVNRGQKPIVQPRPVNQATNEGQLIKAKRLNRTEQLSPAQPIKSAPPIDMNLPGGPSSLATQPTVKVKRPFKIKKLVLSSLAVVLVLLLGTGGVLASKGLLKIHRAFNGSAASVAGLRNDVNPSLLKGEGDGRVNILLLGRGGGRHDAPDLTDTMILASIDPVNNTAVMISIPRDLWITDPGHGSMKINAAWETGEFGYFGKVQTGSTNPAAIQAGFDEVDKVVTSIFGVTINYNVILNFQAFKQAVDTVGGVTVNVPTDLYDPTMAWENHNNPLLAKAGVQNFNGTQALIYVRSRETTSDFARSLRQRTVMLALKSKVDTLGTLSNPIKIAGLINAFGNNVATDLSLSDASRLYNIVKNISDSNITSVGLSDAPNHFITTGSMKGQSIDLPTAGLNNYSAIQAFIRTQLKDGHIIKENAKILVLNGTATAGLATKVGKALTSYGYTVVGMANAPTNGYDQTMVVDLTKGKDAYTKHYLEQRFNLTAINALPAQTINANGADFVIIIGGDEITSPKI